MQSVYTFLEIIIRNHGAKNVNNLAYNISWAAAASTYASTGYLDPIIYNTEWRHSSYAFCNTTNYGSCSILAFNSYGDTIFDQSLTPYLFSVPDGSCKTSSIPQFILSEEAFDKIINDPPTPVVESYYKCKLSE